MNSSEIIEDIKSGDATTPEIIDWCDENGLKYIPNDVLLAFLNELDDDEYLVDSLCVDNGIGSYLNLDSLKFLIEKGFLKNEPEEWFCVFSNDEQTWDYDILKYLLVDLKLKPTINMGFDIGGLWQDEIFELAYICGVDSEDDDIDEIMKGRGIKARAIKKLKQKRKTFLDTGKLTI